MIRITNLVPLLICAATTIAAPLGFLGNWYANSIPGYNVGYGYSYSKPATSFSYYDSGYPYSSGGINPYGSGGINPYGGGGVDPYQSYPSYRGSGFKTTRPYFGTGYETRGYGSPLGIGDYGPYNSPGYAGGIGTEYGAPYPGGTFRSTYGGGYRGVGYGRSGGYGGTYGGVPYYGPTYSSKYNQ